MSSNIRIQRICGYCDKEFTAKTTVTQYCSDRCAKLAYKARKRSEKISASDEQTKQIRIQPIEVLKAKEYLTVRDVAELLGCSLRTVYRLIDNETIKSVNLAQRMTRVKKSELDLLLSPTNKPKPIKLEREPLEKGKQASTKKPIDQIFKQQTLF
ncbi:MAG: helix-turn-helix domain-containing protein [Mangrovibacterium sp.]